MGVAELGPSVFVAPVPYNWLVAIAVPPAHRPLTEEDLARLPDDGLRYELIDGELLVSPSPAGLHQRVSMNLSLILAAAVPAGHEVLAAPFDWRVNRFNVFVPDVLVVPHLGSGAKRLERPPLLAVEILSPSSRQRDLALKKRAYEAAGLGWYWVVDPDAPSLTVFRLDDGRFSDVSVVAEDEPYRATDPFPVEVVPSALVRPAAPRSGSPHLPHYGIVAGEAIVGRDEEFLEGFGEL